MRLRRRRALTVAEVYDRPDLIAVLWRGRSYYEYLPASALASVQRFL